MSDADIVFMGQDIRIRRKIRRDISTASNFRIYYVKGDGKTKGYWAANRDGQDIYYDLPAAQNDQAGVWSFQAYFEIGLKKYYGTVTTKEFKKPLS